MTIGFIAIAMLMTMTAIALVAAPLLRRRANDNNAPVAATVAAVILPAAALLVYASVSNYDWVTPSASAGRESMAMSQTEMPDMVRQLEERLAAAPGDADGWILLGRSYAQLNLLSKAQAAFNRALQLAPTNEARLSVAEVDIMLDRSSLTGVAGQQVEAVLADEPNNPKALFYGGMVAMARNDIPTVRARWGKLLELSPPENIRAILEVQLAQLDSLPTGDLGATDAARGEAGNRTAVSTDNGIDVRVEIADELVSQMGSRSVLFLVARNPGGSGPPVAAVRTASPQFPRMLRISDADAMIPGRSLGALREVKLIARVSNGGDAIAAAGDLFGEVVWVPGNALPVQILIDRIVE